MKDGCIKNILDCNNGVIYKIYFYIKFIKLYFKLYLIICIISVY